MLSGVANASNCVGGSSSTGTGQLPSYLLGSEFVDGQAQNSITPACMRDFVQTVTGSRVITASGAITAATTDHIIEINQTVPAAVTVNMPACNSNAGLQLQVIDGSGTAAADNITLIPSAGTINGSTTFVMNVNRQGELIFYDGTQCVVYP